MNNNNEYITLAAVPDLNLQLTLNSNGSITSRWSAVSGAVRYHLYMHTPGAGTMYFNETNLTTTSYTSMANLEANKQYKVTLVAYGSSNTSVASDGVQILIPLEFYDNTPLGVPGNVNAVSTYNSISVSWDSVIRATSYDVLFNGTVYNLTGTSKAFTGLSSKTSYTYCVRAKNSKQTGTYSTTKTIATSTAPLTVPTNVTATATKNSVTVSWSAVTDATSYIVKWNGTQYSVNTTSITFPGLSTDTAYQYAVCAKNSSETGSYSTLKTITTLPDAPAVPTNVTAIAAINSIKITWDAMSKATDYDVKFNGEILNTRNTSVSYTQLTPNTNYTYAVCANNTGGSSAYSTTKTIKTLMNPPTVPTGLTMTSTENSVIVSWGAVNDAATYDLLFNGTTYNMNGTSKTISGLSSNTEYSGSVRANNASGSSTYSSTRKVKTTPTAPSGATVSSNEGTVTVSWGAVSGATGYDLLFDGTLHSVTGTSKTVTGLSPNTEYPYAIRVKNADGASSYSPSKKVRTTPNPPTGSATSPSKDSVTISFNPAAGATSYDIQFNGTTYRTTDTSKTFTGLKPDTVYPYAIRANNADGVSSYSTEKTVKTLPNPPAMPVDVEASATEYTVTVSFSEVSGATSYDINLSGTIYRVTGRVKTISGLSPDTIYNYSVRANNAGGSSAYTTAKAVQTLQAPPAIPTNVEASATAETVTITWNVSNGALAYQILFNGAYYNTDTTSITIKWLTPETDYIYSVSAMNAIGSSAYSEEQTIRTLKEELPIPDNVDATATLNTVRISWNPVEGATGYDICFDEDIYSINDISTRASFAIKSRSGDFGNSYKVIYGLLPDTTHTYSVRARNERVASEYSEDKTITTDISKESGLPNVSPNQSYLSGKEVHTGIDPVNAVTGAFLWSYTFLEDYGSTPLYFNAMYDSQRDEYDKTLGYKWTYSLNYLLYTDSDYAYFSTPHGTVVPFRIDSENSDYIPVSGQRSGYSMGQEEDGTYYIKDCAGTSYIFDCNLHLKEIMEGGISTYRFQTDENGQTISITGKNGATLSLEHEDGHISKVRDLLGNTVKFTYDGNHLISAENPDGECMSFTYDDVGNLLNITDFSGNSYIENSYDSFNRVITQHLSGRGSSFVSYDTENRITTFTEENFINGDSDSGIENITKYSYNENYQVTDVEVVKADTTEYAALDYSMPDHSMSNLSTQNHYNSEGQLTEQTDVFGNVTRMEYDEYGRMCHTIYPDESEEFIVYNDRNYPVQMIHRDGTTEGYEYDANNNLISYQDQRGNTSYFTYDTGNNLISRTDNKGQIWTYTYDDNHHVNTTTSPEGHSYHYTHDAIGRLLAVTTPKGNTISYEYSATGDLLTMTDTDGTIHYTYNENGNQTAVTDKMGNRKNLRYNEMGLVTLITDEVGREYHFAYDKRGNLIRETDPAGYSVTYTYDALGNITAAKDKYANTTQYTYDSAKRLTQVENALGGITKYTYDIRGNAETITDSLGNTSRYTYDIMGRMIKETDALGNCKSYTYDTAGNLLTQTDANEAVMHAAYDNENQLKSITSDIGIVTFTYDSTGRITELQDADGYRETALYDADGNLIETTDKEGNKTTYLYDSAGRLIKETNPLDNSTSYEYDANGNCTKVTDAEGYIYEYQYDNANRLIKAIDPDLNEKLYQYDTIGNLTLIIGENGHITEYRYNRNGNLSWEMDPAGGITSYTYDTLNRLIAVNDADKYNHTYEYDANSNLTAYTDANGNKWCYEYDALNHLISITDDKEGQVLFTYNPKGEIIKITDKEGAETDYLYDSMGRVIQVTDALGGRMSLSYDSADRVISQTDGEGNITRYTYSPSGNILSICDPDGNETTYTYDELGRLLTQTSMLGNTTSYTYDKLGQITSITNPMGSTTYYTYTAAGQVATVTDANSIHAIGEVTSYEYDERGNLITCIDPLGNTQKYEYDRKDNVIREYIQTQQGKRCSTTYQYNGKNQLIREINALSDEKVYTYDGNGNIISILDEDMNETRISYDVNNKPVWMSYSDGREVHLQYDKRGKLTEFRDWNGTTTIEYDALSRLKKVTDHKGQVISYEYDANGNNTAIIYPDGSRVSYQYDGNNRISEAADAQGDTTRYEYDADGNVSSVIQTAATTTYVYNAADQPVNIRYTLNDGTWMENTLTYDVLGRLISENKIGSTPELTGSLSYTYDALGRLTSSTEGDITESYEYDTFGNRTCKKINGRRAATYTYNELNQLISRTEEGTTYSYTYDKRGNQTEEWCGERLIRQYTYDASNHLVKGCNPETGEETRYTYNALHMRIQNEQILLKKSGGYQGNSQTRGNTSARYRTKEISYVMDYLSTIGNELVVYEKEDSAVSGISVNITYGYGYERLSQNVTVQGEVSQEERPITPRGAIASETIGKVYFQSDRLGSVLFSTNSQGEILRCSERGTWGELKIPVQDDLNTAGIEYSTLFTNYAYNPVIDKYFAKARFYDAKQGRMIAKDPIKTGPNPYPYCDNDPVNKVDLTGKFLHSLFLVGGGALAGGAIGFGSSVISQWLSGEPIDWREAGGSAAGGAIEGAGRGFDIATGGRFSTPINMIAGTFGNAVNQKITKGEVDWGESLVAGASNGINSLVYGGKAPKSVKDAAGKGGLAGAGKSTLRNLYDVLKGQDDTGRGYGQTGTGILGSKAGSLITAPFTGIRDPRTGCGTKNPLGNQMPSGNGKGYQYDDSKKVPGSPFTINEKRRQNGFNLLDFGKNVLIDTCTEMLTNVGLYGVDKVGKFIGDNAKKLFGGGKKGGGNNQAHNIAQYEKLKAQYAADEIVNAERIGSGLKPDPYHRAASYLPKIY